MFKRLYIASYATKKALPQTLKVIVVDGTFLNGHVLNQTVLLAVTFDGNNKHIILAYAIVTFETDPVPVPVTKGFPWAFCFPFRLFQGC